MNKKSIELTVDGRLLKRIVEALVGVVGLAIDEGLEPREWSERVITIQCAALKLVELLAVKRNLEGGLPEESAVKFARDARIAMVDVLNDAADKAYAEAKRHENN